MTRTSSLFLLAGLLGCQGTAPGPSSHESAPNVLLITMDTTRADVLGCYGHHAGATPVLDDLAASSVRFQRAYTAAPLTIPSHSTLFTGLLPPRHGVRDNGDHYLSAGALTLAEILRGAGYATMASVGAEVTSHHWGFNQGFDAFYDDMGESTGDVANRWRVERPGDEVVDDALGWLRSRPGDTPWFAWVHLFDAHHPYRPPEAFAQEFPGLPYLGEVAFVDAQIGRLLDWLQESGSEDHTWIWIMGDHGEGLGSHGEAMHGVLLYNDTTRVPLLVRPAGGVEGQVVQTPVSLVDVMPSVLASLGLPPLQETDGRDLTPSLVADPAPDPLPDHGVYVESLYAWRHYGWAPQRALVTGEYKLIDSTNPELYRWADTKEQQDMGARHPEILQAMRQELQEWVQRLEPDTALAQEAQMSGDRLAQLRALGYVTDVSTPGAPAEGLPDPVQRLPVLHQLELARAAVQQGDPEEAVPILEALLRDEPGLNESRLLLSNILARQGDVPAALALVEEAVRQTPSAQTRTMLANLLVQSGDSERALLEFEQALEADPSLASAWAPYLQLLFLMGDRDRLELAVARAQQAIPEEPEVIGFRGILLAQGGAFQEAAPLLQAALEKRPTMPFLNYSLGLAMHKLHQDEQAEPFLLEEARLFPSSLPVKKVLVEIYASQRRYAEQIDQLLPIIQAEPPNHLTFHSLAQAQYNDKRYPEALETVQECRALAPGYPACAMLLANVLKKLGRDDEAQAAYRQALEIGEQVTGMTLTGSETSPSPDTP